MRSSNSLLALYWCDQQIFAGYWRDQCETEVMSSECCAISKILNLTKEWEAVYLLWNFTDASSKFSAPVTEETSVKLRICQQNVVSFQGGTLLMRPANFRRWLLRDQCETKDLSSVCCVISGWHFTDATSKSSVLVTKETSVKLKICHQNVVSFQNYWTWLRNEKQ